jgi:hypothetical protein
MKTRLIPILVCIVSLLFLTSGGVAAPAAAPLGTAFTYQGRLDRGGTPFTGTCNFEFGLWDAETGGVSIGDVEDITGQPISNGLFTVELDFGAGAFNGDVRWLDIRVICPDDLDYTAFPRQALTAAPYALYASSVPWSGITGRPAGLDDGDNDTTYTNGYGLSLTGDTFSVNPDEVQFRVIDSCPAGSALRVIYEDGTVGCETDDGTVFTTGSGLSLSAGVLAIDPLYTQRRVSSTCAAGSSIREILGDGMVICETDDGTTYTAGNGISVVGNTISIDPAYTQRRVNGICNVEEMMYFIDEDGNVYCDTDDNTTYSAGSGLSLTSTTFSIDSAYTQRRVSNTCTAGSSIRAINLDGTVICETDDNTTYSAGSGLSLSTTSFSIDSAYTQRRINNNCAVGSSIRAINEDGSVECQVGLPGKAPFALSTLDSTNNVGEYTSITIGADGLGLISYHYTTGGALRVAHCNNPACSSSTISTLDSGGSLGWYTSIAIGSDGLGLISYYDYTNGNLKVAHCNDIACSNPVTPVILDSTNDVGMFSSIAIGVDGLGLISYYDTTNGDLKVAHCNDIPCSSATVPTPFDSTNNVGMSTSIAIGADGLGLISYHDETNGDLKVAHCNNINCSAATLTTIDSSAVNMGHSTSITIGTDGLGLISYMDQGGNRLRAAHCSDSTCSTATLSTLDSSAAVGNYTSITIGSDGLGLISYYNSSTLDLKVAHCNDINCSSARSYTLDTINHVGWWTGITIGPDGFGLISYYDWTNGDLKTAHCSNIFCMPYSRQR